MKVCVHVLTPLITRCFIILSLTSSSAYWGALPDLPQGTVLTAGLRMRRPSVSIKHKPLLWPLCLLGPF